VSLPSVKFLLDQATSLVKYMGDKHRFRLKPASALEAVAAMYGKHDWNTLHGLATRASEQASADAAAPMSAPDSYPLTWSALGHRQLTVGRDDWYRHTLASGGALADRQTWLQQHFGEHMERGGAGVFLNAFGKLPVAAREALHGERILVDLVHEDCTFSVNLMADMTPDAIGAMSAALIFARDRGLTDDYWKQSVNMVVTVVARALREAGQHVTYVRLAELFPVLGEPTQLHKLMLSLPAESEARQHLAGILAPHSAAGGVFSEKTWASHYSVLSRGLGQLAESPWTRGLFSTLDGAQGLFSLLSQRKCLVIECPDRAAGLPERAVLYAMRSALVIRSDLTGENRTTPWVFALSEVDGYLSSALAGMAARGRGAQVALLMTTRDAGVLNAHPAGRELLANVWNTLHLRGCTPAQLAELLEKMSNRPVLVQPSRVSAAT
jgi:hypothetical protein